MSAKVRFFVFVLGTPALAIGVLAYLSRARKRAISRLARLTDEGGAK